MAGENSTESFSRSSLWGLAFLTLVALVSAAMMGVLAERLSAPSWVPLLFPLALAGGVAFLLFPTLGLFAWAFLCGLAFYPIIGGEIFLYDIFTAFLSIVLFIKIFTDGRFRLASPDGAVLLVIFAMLLSVIMNIHRMPEVAERFYLRRWEHLGFLGKTSLSGCALWLSYILAYFYASRLADSAGRIRGVLVALFLMAIGNSLYALWFWAQHPAGFSRVNRTMGLLQDIQDQGYLSAVFIVGLIIFFIFRVLKGYKAILAACGGSLLLLNFVFNFTRTAYAMFAVGIAVLVLLTGLRRMALLIILAGFLIIILVVFVEVDRQNIQYITDVGSRKGGGLPLRMVTWLDAVRIIREEGGFWGIGHGNYVVYSDAATYTALARRMRLSSAHSMHLQILAEQGVPGVAAWLGFYAIALGYFYRKFTSSLKPMGKALNLWVLVLLLMMLADSMIYMGLLPPPHSHEALTFGYFVWMIMGITVAWNRLEEQPEPVPRAA